MYSKSRAGKVIALTLAMLFLVFQFSSFAFAEEKTSFSLQEISAAIDEIIQYIYKNNEDLELTEWQIIGMTGAGIDIPEKAYENLEEYLKEQDGYFRKITDYAKLAMAVVALNRDPRNVAGYDIIEKIYNNENMTLQGSNGPIFSLMALDAWGCSIPEDALWTREKLLDYILNQQNADGSFSLTSGEKSDIDLTAMAIQGLVGYKEKPEVLGVIEKAVDFLSKNQSADGGFLTWGDVTSESISQTIIALTALGIDPAKDSRFVKDGNLISKLFSFKEADGGFSHIQGLGPDDMATEQALVALVAYKRFLEGKGWIYDMKKDMQEEEAPLPEEDVSFADMDKVSQWAKEYIEKGTHPVIKAVMANQIMMGDNGVFSPRQKVTREMAAAAIVRVYERGEQ